MSLLKTILKETSEGKKRPTRKLLTVKDLKVGKQYHLEDEIGEKFKAVIMKIIPLESSEDRPNSYEVQYKYADDSYHKKGQTDWFDVTADEQVFSIFESIEEAAGSLPGVPAVREVLKDLYGEDGQYRQGWTDKMAKGRRRAKVEISNKVISAAEKNNDKVNADIKKALEKKGYDVESVGWGGGGFRAGPALVVMFAAPKQMNEGVEKGDKLFGVRMVGNFWGGKYYETGLDTIIVAAKDAAEAKKIAEDNLDAIVKHFHEKKLGSQKRPALRRKDNKVKVGAGTIGQVKQRAFHKTLTRDGEFTNVDLRALKEQKLTEVSLKSKISALRKMTHHRDEDDWYGDSLAAEKALNKRSTRMRNKIRSKHGEKAVRDAERGVEIDKHGRENQAGGWDPLDKRPAKIMKGGPRKGKMDKKDIEGFKRMAKYRLSQKNEEAAAGATAAHSIAGAHGGLGSEPDGSEPSEKLPRARPLWNVKKKKKKKKPMKESLLRQLTLHEEDDPSFDQADVISKLKASEKSAEADQDTVAFGLEDEDGNIVKVHVRTAEAEDFQKALETELSRIGEDDEEDDQPVTQTEIAEVLFTLKDKFEIVDVEWGEIPEDEEVEQGMDADVDADVDIEGGEEGMDDEMSDEEGMDDEEDAKTALQQVIDMMKADAEAKTAEANAKKAEAEAESAKYAAQAATAKVKQEEEVLDMEAYNKAESDKSKEAKTLAQLAKYKHSVAKDEVETGMEDNYDMDPEVDVDVDADVDVDVEDEEETISVDDLMDLLRNRLASN